MTLKQLLTALCLFFCASWAHAQTDCPPTSWVRLISPGDQQFEVVERIDLGQGREISGITFGALEGEFSKAHMLMGVSTALSVWAAEAQIGSADRDPRDRQFFNFLEMLAIVLRGQPSRTISSGPIPSVCCKLTP